MKMFFSFSELGSCCRAETAPASESHAPPRLRRASSRKCSAAAVAAQWSPGLPAISEDVAVISRARTLPNKPNPTPRTKVGSTLNTNFTKTRSYSTAKDNTRTNSVPVIIPVFSPTPFVF